MRLTLFYDSQCPLCAAEINQLGAFDRDGRLRFVDLHGADFSQRYPHIDTAAANRILHAQLDSGEMLYGLDVTCRAWTMVGKHKWLAILRWPVLRHIADVIYLFFARYRNGISWLLTGQRRCNDNCNYCSVGDTASKPIGVKSGDNRG